MNDRCNIDIKAQGFPYPRTCAVCGLGPCKYAAFQQTDPAHLCIGGPKDGERVSYPRNSFEAREIPQLDITLEDIPERAPTTVKTHTYLRKTFDGVSFWVISTMTLEEVMVKLLDTYEVAKRGLVRSRRGV